MKTLPTPQVKTVSATGYVKGGVVYLHDKRSFQALQARLPDGPIVIEIGLGNGTRSLAANKRYFAILRQIVQALDDAGLPKTSDALHAECKTRYNAGRSTTSLSDREFSAYTERVMAGAAIEWGVGFPEPERL